MPQRCAIGSCGEILDVDEAVNYQGYLAHPSCAEEATRRDDEARYVRRKRAAAAKRAKKRGGLL